MVLWELPRAKPKGTLKGQFCQGSLRLFHSLSDVLNLVGQSGTIETLKIHKQKLKRAFRLFLGSSLVKLHCIKPNSVDS